MANEENLKPFKKGEDERRNVNGRPKKLPKLDDLLADILGSEEDKDSEAHAILQRLVTDAKSGNTKAAEIILDRAYGKSKQSIDLSSSDGSFSLKEALGFDSTK